MLILLFIHQSAIVILVFNYISTHLHFWHLTDALIQSDVKNPAALLFVAIGHFFELQNITMISAWT